MRRVALVAVLLGSAIAFAKGPQKAGNWHITVTSEMPGMPMQPPPQTLDKCITPEQSDDPKRAIKEQNSDCEPADVKVVANKVSYKMTCHKHGGTQNGVGELTFAGDSYAGTMTLEMNDPRRGPMKIVQHIQATRTGDCKP